MFFPHDITVYQIYCTHNITVPIILLRKQAKNV